MTRWGSTLHTVTKNLASNVRILAMTLFVMGMAINLPAAATTWETPITAAMPTGSTQSATVVLDAAVTNGHVTVEMNATYVTKHATSILGAGWAGDFQTVDVSLTNAPDGNHTVGTIHITDENDNAAYDLLVNLVDGGIEIDVIEF